MDTFWFMHIRIVHRKINPEYCTQSIFNFAHIYFLRFIHIIIVHNLLCTNTSIKYILIIVHNLLRTNTSIKYILVIVHNLLCTNTSIKYSSGGSKNVLSPLGA